MPDQALEIRRAETVLIIDDDPLLCHFARTTLAGDGYRILLAHTAESGEALAQQEKIDLILLDINIPEMGGEKLLPHLLHAQPQRPVIVFTAMKEIDLAVRCIKMGAVDFISKPCEATRLSTTVRNALHLRDLSRRIEELEGPRGIESGYDLLFGQSPSMLAVIGQLRMLEKSDISVCIEGPSGTGKELVARALHRRGARAAGPFIAINCGAIPDTMLESELFGHEKGSFTGAIATRQGCFEQANKGTLFLDEIGDMRMDLQVRLLRALENKELRRVGGTQTIHFDVRIITATHRDLKSMVERGSFREDLYYRLAVFKLALPTLKERGSDIVGLAERFAVEFASRLGRRFRGFEREAVDVLMSYDWPGNVRELRNVIERASLLCAEGIITLAELPAEILPDGVKQEFRTPSLVSVVPHASVQAVAVKELKTPENEEILTFEEEEHRLLLRALRIAKGDVQLAATKLQLGPATLYRKINKFNIDIEALRN